MTEGIELPNQVKIRTLEEKESYKYLEILETTTIRQADMKEKWKRIPQENEKTIRNQTVLLKSHQRDKHLSCPPRKTLGIILKVDEGKISTNVPKNKKTHDDA